MRLCCPSWRKSKYKRLSERLEFMEDLLENEDWQGLMNAVRNSDEDLRSCVSSVRTER